MPGTGPPPSEHKSFAARSAVAVLISLVTLLVALISPSPPIGAAGAAPSGASIASVRFAGTKTAPTVIVNGRGFGGSPPAPTRLGSRCEPTALGNFYGSALNVHDLTGRWKAGTYVGQLGFFDAIIIDSWTNNRVAFHFDGCWADHGKTLNPGDALVVSVRAAARNVIVPDGKSTETLGRTGIVAPGTFTRLVFPVAPAAGWSSTRLDVRVLRAPLSDPNAFYFYAEQWELKAPSTPDGLVIGYMGIQTQGGTTAGVGLGPTGIVSFFTPVPLGIVAGTGTDGNPASCETSTSTGEGFISTCRIRFAWQQAHTYRYRFALVGPGQWAATITDLSVANRPVSTIGRFAMPADWLGLYRIDAGFLEQYVSPPETTTPTDPVCPWLPQHRTTAQYLNARVNDTVAPSVVQPGLHAVNDVGTRLVCQNATATAVPGGVQLDMDLRAPAPPADPRAVRSGRSITVSWAPRRDPATVTRGQIENSMFSTSQLGAIAALARPRPTAYTVTASPGGATETVGVARTHVTFARLRHRTTYQFSITADNNGGHSAPVVVTARIPAGP